MHRLFSPDRRRILQAASLAATLISVRALEALPPISGALTYQGQLKLDGVPLNETLAFEFTLWDAASEGNQVGTTIALDVDVVNGLFQVQLNAQGQFGPDAFDGNARWLQVSVRSGTGDCCTPTGGSGCSANTECETCVCAQDPFCCETEWDDLCAAAAETECPACGCAFTDLSPRNAITAAPYALAIPGLRTSPSSLAGGARAHTDHQGAFVWAESADADFSSTGPNQFLIRAGGNVGIDTTSPTSKLDVAGTVEPDGLKLNGNGAAEGRVLTSNANGVASWQDPPAGSSPWTMNGPDIRYSDGEVGIGTGGSLPRANALEVTGRTELNNAHINAADCVEPLSVYNCWGYPDTPVAIFHDVWSQRLELRVPEGQGRAELQAWNGMSDQPGIIALNPDGGNVGIGTAAPASRLDVAGTMEADGLKLNGNGAAAGRVLTSDAAGVATRQTPPSAIWSTNGPFVYYNNGPMGLGQTCPNCRSTYQRQV